MLKVQATTYRIENFAGVCYAMSFGYAILITHVLAQPGVRKIEALGRGVRHLSLEFLWGPQRDKG